MLLVTVQAIVSWPGPHRPAALVQAVHADACDVAALDHVEPATQLVQLVSEVAEHC